MAPPIRQRVIVEYDGKELRIARDDMRGYRKESAAAIGQTDAEVTRLERGFGKLKMAAASFFAAAGFGALLRGVIGVNGRLETLRVTFSTMLGSADAADRMLKGIFAFAETTPYQFDQVVNSARSLLAVGVEAGDIFGKLRPIGDVAAGVAAPIEEVVQVYAKVQALNRASMEEIRMLAERGIPVFAELADMYGVSQTELGKLIERGKVSAESIDELFERMATNGGRFEGMMDRLSQTSEGIISTLKDIGESLFREATGPLFDQMKTWLDLIAAGIAEARKSGQLSETLRSAGQAAADVLSGLAKAVSWVWEHRTAITRLVVAYTSYRLVLIGAAAAQKAYAAAVLFAERAMVTYRAITIAVNSSTRVLLNMLKVNPITAVATAIAGLTVGLLAWKDRMAEAAEKQASLTQHVKDAAAAYDQLNEKQREVVRTSLERQRTELGMQMAQIQADIETLRQLRNEDIRGEGVGYDRKIDQLQGKMESLRSVLRNNVELLLRLNNPSAVQPSPDPNPDPNPPADPSAVSGWEGSRHVSVRRRIPFPKESEWRSDAELLLAYLEDYQTAITDIQNRERSGLITAPESFELQATAAQAFAEKVQQAYSVWREAAVAAGFSTEELDRAFHAAFGTIKEGGAEASQRLKDLGRDTGSWRTALSMTATALRAVARSSDVFGGLDENLRKSIDATADLIDNYFALADAIDRMNSAKDKGEAVSTLDKLGSVASGVGLAVSIASAVSGLLGMLDRSGNERLIVGLTDVERALRDNARDITTAIKDWIRAETIGGGIQGSDLDKARQAWGLSGTMLLGYGPQLAELARLQREFEQARSRYIENMDDPALESGLKKVYEDALRRLQLAQRGAQGMWGSGGADLWSGVTGNQLGSGRANLATWFNSLLTGLEDSGAITDSVADSFRSIFQSALDRFGPDQSDQLVSVIQALLTGSDMPSGLGAPPIEGGLEAWLDRLFGDFGGTGESLAAAISSFQMLTSLLGLEGPAAFEELREALLKFDDDASALSSDLRSAIEGFDVSTESGRQALRSFIETTLRSLQAGMLSPEFFGDLTPDELRTLLSTLSGFAEPGVGAAGEPEFTRSVQIARSITEIQTNELIALTETGNLRLEQIRDILAMRSGADWEPSWLGGRPPGDGDTTIDVNIGPGVILDAALPEILYRVEQRVREAIRSQP